MIDRAVGLVYAPGLEALLEPRGLVDLLEIEPEMYWCEGPEGSAGVAVHRAAWAAVRALPRPMIVHGVGAAVGGGVIPDPAYRALWNWCVADLDAAWASHHLSFNWFGPADAPRFTGFFLPPRQSDDGVRAATASIRAMQEGLACPLAVETPVSYLAPRDDELPDGEFVARVVRATDCHLVLDLHNLWCNERNGRQSIEAYLDALPLDRVIEVHVAGGFAVDGYWLDAHSGAPPDELYDMLAEVAPRLPNARAVVLEVLASFVPGVGIDAIATALERIRAAWSRAGVCARSPAPVSCPREPAPGSSADEWEQALGALVIGEAPTTALGATLAADPAIPLLLRLVEHARAGLLTDALPLTTRLLLVALGADTMHALLERFWRAEPPRAMASSEARACATWLAAQSLDVPCLADAIALDLACVDADAHGTPVEVELSIDPFGLRDTLTRAQLPASGSVRIRATVTPPY